MVEQADFIKELADSMLASAVYEATPGITLDKVVKGLEERIDYPKAGQGARLSKGQKNYVRRLLKARYRSRIIDGEKYYF
jgi:hypothetical protein